jgi:hypothetical protein
MSDDRSPGGDFPAVNSEADRLLLAQVQTHGWHVLRVSSEDESTGWAFSVGLYHSFRHPEIVIFGRTTEIMHATLDRIGRDIKAGQRFEDRAECDGLIDGSTCTFRNVQPGWHEAFLGYAIWLYRGAKFPALQCIWPDGAGKYPWQSGFRSEWAELQPLLFHDTVGPAGVAPWLRSMGVESERSD